MAKTKNSPKKSTRKKRKGPFPTNTLEDALKVAQVIKDKNNGHPWNTADVAKACGLTKASPKFFYLAASARDYGITEGSRDTPQIGLTDLGRSIVFAGDSETQRQKKIEAFLSIEIFKRVFDHYNGSAKLPEGEFLGNSLQDQFGLDPSFHEAFVEVFKANCTYLGIESGLDASRLKQKNGDSKIDIRVLGQPKGEFDKTAFVIMPFTEKGEPRRPTGFFDEVLKSLITPAGNGAGFSVQTARREGSDLIHHTIINQLLAAELVIADLTDHNPNVLFELGIRIAQEKPVALIKSDDTKEIFDVDSLMRVFKYDRNLWTTTIEADLTKLTDHIKGGWDNRDTYPTYMSILTAPQQLAEMKI